MKIVCDELVTFKDEELHRVVLVSDSAPSGIITGADVDGMDDDAVLAPGSLILVTGDASSYVISEDGTPVNWSGGGSGPEPTPAPTDTRFYALLGDTLTSLTDDTVTSLRAYALTGAYALTSLSLPNCTEIGYAACSYNGLETADLPLLTSMGQNAFQGASDLLTVNIPRVTRLPKNAFASCGSLGRLILPACTQIDTYALHDSSLAVLVIGTQDSATVCTLGNADALAGTAFSEDWGSIYVPDDLVSAYKAASNWSQFASLIKPLSEFSA